jgi:hypothetical protein
VYDVVRRHVGFLDRDRRLDTELRSLVDALRAGELASALEREHTYA